MTHSHRNYLVYVVLLFTSLSFAQVDEEPIGGWYNYNYNILSQKTPSGINGEVQYTGYEVIQDLNWLLFRAGVTYELKDSGIKFALGYGHVTFGVIGPDDSKITENRIYQQVNIPMRLFGLKFLNRFRSEQRFFNGFFRSRYRFGIFTRIPFGKKEVTVKTVYLALYDEFFLNGERQLNNGAEVDYFDQNRLYAALGYAFTKSFKIEMGAMLLTRSTDERLTFQLSLFQNI